MFAEKKFILAPMAEITTPALRRTVAEFSPGMILFSEMLSAGAVCTRANHNEPLIMKTEFDENLIYQIAGNDPDIMAESSLILQESGCFGIDINMGCSAPDILKKKQGAALLADFNRAREIVSACRKTVRTKLSVKIRAGIEKNDRELMLNFIKMFADEGVDFVTIHPRWAKISFKRNADWEMISIAKKISSIPVVGNGDIVSPIDAIKMMKDTACDAVMIGREAVKSPWIFSLSEKLASRQTSKLEVNIRNVFIQTLGYISQYLPERLHKSRGHRFCFYFSKNVKFGHQLFSKIRQLGKIDEMITEIDEYFNRNRDESLRLITFQSENRTF